MENETIRREREKGVSESYSYQTVPGLEEGEGLEEGYAGDGKELLSVESPKVANATKRLSQYRYSFEAAEIEARYRTYNETGRWQRPCILIVAILFAALFISLPFLVNIFAQGPHGKMVW
jgi:hypothetical protein